MMKVNNLLYIVGALFLFSACNSEDDAVIPDANLEIRGIIASICNDHLSLTRADDTKTLGVGRTEFVNDDKVMFTTIKRTEYPLKAFTYSNIEYYYDGTWERTSSDPEKIYWSDVTSAHTLAGYSLPVLSSVSYHWNPIDNSGITTYEGQLGFYVKGDIIDFSTGNDAIKDEDLLVSYSDTTKASSSAMVSFTHALSNVCVVVNVKDYAVNELDMDVDILEMKILNQPCKFRWGGNSDKLSTLNCKDENQVKKSIKLWKNNVSGKNQNKTFTFYGLTTPQDATYRGVDGNNDPLEFEFSVKYQDVTKLGSYVTKTYHGSISGVEFDSGKCTTINVALSHGGEQMYIDVNYTDWNYVASPDLGKLRKKSTFMEMSIDDVYRWDETSSIDDATWLYKGANNKILDVYGNDGSKEHPYIIKSASQMLSFAKEVKAGLSFEGQYIRLDADITMQASTAKTKEEGNTSGKAAVEWVGIGVEGKPFCGTFLGGDRYINRLYGSPLFTNIGDGACVEQVYISPIGTINGNGALADSNNGIIAACKVVDEVSTTVGALVGTNNGTIYACYYTGTTGATSLVGTNNAPTKTVGCYVASDYQTFTKTDVDGLNANLDALYVQNTSLTQFEYVYSVGNYPTVKKK